MFTPPAHEMLVTDNKLLKRQMESASEQLLLISKENEKVKKNYEALKKTSEETEER